MGLFLVGSSCAPGFQYDGVLYKPGESVAIPPERVGDMPFSLGEKDRKVFDKLIPLDDEAAEMSGKKSG